MYYGAQAPAEPERPGIVMAGVVTVFTTVVLSLGTTVALLKSYQWVKAQSLTGTASDEQLLQFMQSYMAIIIGFYAIISIALGIGALMVLRQNNGGRIIIWIAGGVLAVTNLCCGFGFFGLIAAINEAANQSSSYSSSSSATTTGPTTELTIAGICTIGALVAVVVAMILIAQGSVGRWIKGTPAATGMVAPTGYMPGSPVAYPQPQQPYVAPPQPQQPQYPPQQPPYGGDQYGPGPGSYGGGDQYGPGYNGGDQYGPGPTSGPPGY